VLGGLCGWATEIAIPLTMGRLDGANSADGSPRARLRPCFRALANLRGSPRLWEPSLPAVGVLELLPTAPPHAVSLAGVVQLRGVLVCAQEVGGYLEV